MQHLVDGDRERIFISQHGHGERVADENDADRLMGRRVGLCQRNGGSGSDDPLKVRATPLPCTTSPISHAF